MKKNMFFVFGCKIVATDDGTLWTQWILTLTLICIVIFCVKDFAGYAELIK